uniref:Uncharacterized protein n=1 Tax=Strongyloides stercoralis TaxID=6248 RepID=A0A0K0E553_STRER
MGCNVSVINKEGKKEVNKIKVLGCNERFTIDKKDIIKEKISSIKTIDNNEESKNKIKKCIKKKENNEILKTARLKEFNDDSIVTFPEDETLYDIPQTMSDLSFGNELTKIEATS